MAVRRYSHAFQWKLYAYNDNGVELIKSSGMGRGANIVSKEDIPVILREIERDLTNWMQGVDVAVKPRSEAEGR